MDVLVLGAGIFGCAAAQELQAQGMDYLLLEKNVEPGGLTRSISVGEGHFEYTGHFLHLARWKHPEEIFYARQKKEDWQPIERRSVVFIANRPIPAPLQYHLYSMGYPGGYERNVSGTMRIDRTLQPRKRSRSIYCQGSGGESAIFS